MKNDSGSIKVIFGHVELEQVSFTFGEEMGIDFQNEIDAWTKMEIVFRQQIKSLKENKKFKRTFSKKLDKSKADLNSLIYSFREKLE